MNQFVVAVSFAACAYLPCPVRFLLCYCFCLAQRVGALPGGVRVSLRLRSAMLCTEETERKISVAVGVRAPYPEGFDVSSRRLARPRGPGWPGGVSEGISS